MSQARMVNMAFMTAALLLWIVSADLFSGALDMVRPEWDLRIIGNEFRLHDLMGIAVGVIGGIWLWRHERIFQLANEVAFETRKVTWPPMDETRQGTIVVVVVTILIALVLWGFDVLFSALTKVFYNL